MRLLTACIVATALSAVTAKKKKKRRRDADDATPAAPPTTPAAPAAAPPAKMKTQDNPTGATRLFMGNLPWSITDDQLAEACGCELKAIKRITDKESGKFYGSVFVEASDAAAAGAAVKKSGQDVGGRPVKMSGSASSMVDVSLELDVASSTATITLSGPAAVWFGVGFAANASRSKEEKQVNLAKGITGGLPDFVEEWTPDLFRKVGKGLGVAAVASWPLAFHHDISLLVPLLASGATVGYWKIGLDDLKQTSSALPKNFPVLIHLRYILESIRPEIQQYFIEADESQGQVPFTRAMRSTIYQRAKGAQDTRALGTRRNVYGEGFEWANHSMFPVSHADVEDRVTIGGSRCAQPYSASLLNISAMSFGALSANAIEALNRGAARGGFYHNTGEGGISRFHLSGGDVVWNVGTGYFGCGKTIDDKGTRAFCPDQFRENATKEQVKMIEIKLSQGLCGNQPVRRVHRQFFTKSFLGDEVAVLTRSSGEEPASSRHRAGGRVDGVEDDSAIQQNAT